MDNQSSGEYRFALFNLPWQAQSVRQFADKYDDAVPTFGWPVYVLNNHDRSRIASQIGPQQPCCATILLLTLPGTSFIYYYGEALGMENAVITPEQVQDPWERNVPGFGCDSVRTPMCWDSSPNAGFSGGQPWLPLGQNWQTANLQNQQQDE
jgi:alpha-glucosidase